jgi:energy-coupling factor transporter ATP-binding protein EcfA2
MPKRITKIELQNCRVYHGNHKLLSLNEGENLLIYGENGSGKSSLFKGLKSYFASSIKPSTPFPVNTFASNDKGFIRVRFGDFDINQSLLSGPQVEFEFGNFFSNTNQPFIELTSYLGGFLDYTDLLKVYFHKEPNPNLFELIVLNLLGQQIPFNTGGTFRFGPKWFQLQADLINARTRRTYRHQAALNELPRYQTHLQATLLSVFEELNRLLREYFTDLEIELGFELEPLSYIYGHRSNWHTNAELYLLVYHNGNIIEDHNDFLNEARLSAFSICLYLASLLQNPSLDDELKLLYLDDVFIGLDAGNRRPILEILRHEFSGYQKIISTYDRHWYELAKRQFEIIPDSNWACIEFYVGKKTVDDKSITEPIVVIGNTYYEKAIQYLSDRQKPDYPAAANYFRKHLEEIFNYYLPLFEKTDVELTQLAGYKLNALLKRGLSFFNKTENDPSNIQIILQFLNVLIHPLSHHDITAPIYKTELVILQNAINNLEEQLKAIQPLEKYRCVLEPGKHVKISIKLDESKKHEVNYTLTLSEPLIISLNSDNNPQLARCTCYAFICEGTLEGVKLDAFKPSKKDRRFTYSSLQNAYDQIFEFYKNQGAVTLVKNVNYLADVTYFTGEDWRPIQTRIVWK